MSLWMMKNNDIISYSEGVKLFRMRLTWQSIRLLSFWNVCDVLLDYVKCMNGIKATFLELWSIRMK